MPEENQKPGFRRRLIKGVGWGILGAFAGAGLEDILAETNIASVGHMLDYLSVLTGGLGFTFGFLKGGSGHAPDDEPEEKEAAPAKKKPDDIKLKAPTLYGFSESVKRCSRTIKNKGIADGIHSAIVGYLGKNPIENARRDYESFRKSISARWGGVFKPFEHKGSTIDPRQVLDDFFAKAEKMYNFALESGFDRLDVASRQAIEGKPTYLRQSAFRYKFRGMLDEELCNAYEISIWLSDLAARGGKVGSKVTEKLAQHGVDYPENLPGDVKALAKNILKWYDALINPKFI